MKKAFILVAALSVLLFACSKKEKGIYPKYHYASFYNAEGKATHFLTWGEKLIDLNSKKENPKLGTLYKVKRSSDDSIGYVRKKEIIKNPVALGVILDKTLVYGTPVITSRKKKSVTPPILAYVTEVKEKGKEKWYRITCYNPPSKDYQVRDNTSRIWGKQWIKASDISLSDADVKIISSVQMSLKNFRLRKKIYMRNTAKEYSKKKYYEAIETEKASLQELTTTYSKSKALPYAKEAIEIIASDKVTENKPESPDKQPKPMETESEKLNESEMEESN